MSNSKVIYTAIFGGIDDLIEPEGEYKGYDFICFSDRAYRSRKFKVIKVARVFDDPAMDARMYKMLPHIFLSNYTTSVWIDSRVKIKKKDLDFVLNKYLSDKFFAVFPHMHRNCIYEEAKACIYRNKDNVLSILKQALNYSYHNYPENNGGVETGVLLRKHMHGSLIKFSEAWWHELNKFSKRDQISFNFISWKLGFRFNYIDGYIWNNKYFEVNEMHLKDRRKQLNINKSI